MPISVAAAHADSDLAGPDRVPADQLEALAQVTDPRAARGVRHGFVAVLAVGFGAVLGGARSYTAIAEWARDLPVGIRVRLGLARITPSESTIRRTLQAVDADDPDSRCQPGSRREPPRPARRPARRRWAPSRPARAIAIDGKSARGARGPDGRPVRLIAAFDHDSGIVLGQTVVDGKTNEITAFAPLLDRVEVTGAVITADALHTQRAHAEYLHKRGAHYVLTVKCNRPRLHDQLATQLVSDSVHIEHGVVAAAAAADGLPRLGRRRG